VPFDQLDLEMLRRSKGREMVSERDTQAVCWVDC
jgi:hypothetical protein